MNDPFDRDPALKALSTELRHVQRQLTVLHQQGFVMLRVLSALMNRLAELNDKESAMARDVGDMEKELAQLVAAAPAASLCPSCGGPLDHHIAASGELHICTSCGFSQFVDRHGIVRSTAQPPPPPPADGEHPPSSWVG